MKKTIATLSLMALMLGTTTAFAGVTKQDHKDNKSATTNTTASSTKSKQKAKAKTSKQKPEAAKTKPSGK